MDSDSAVLEAIGSHLAARSRMVRAVTGANPPTGAEWDAHNAEGDRIAAVLEARQAAARGRHGAGGRSVLGAMRARGRRRGGCSWLLAGATAAIGLLGAIGFAAEVICG